MRVEWKNKKGQDRHSEDMTKEYAEAYAKRLEEEFEATDIKLEGE